MDDFLPQRMAEMAEAAFPSVESRDWKHYESEGGKKLEMADYARMPKALQEVVHYVNRTPRGLFGFDDLFPDHALYGGGLNMARPGDFLKPHADFNWNDELKAYRTVNLILYLNRDWREEWGGVLDLNGERVLPTFNRAVAFVTRTDAVHGYGPVTGPVPRKSIGFYFYRKAPADGVAVEPHRTLWAA